MTTAPAESARWLRRPDLDGVEGLRARFFRHRYPVHVHEHWTLAWIRTGAATYQLGRDEHVVRAGQLVVIPPGTVHSGSPTPGGYSYTALYVDPARVPDLAGTAGPITGSIRPGPGLERTLTTADRLLATPGTDPETDAELLEAMAALSPLLGRSRETRTRTPRAVRIAARYLHERDGKAPLDEVARASGVSKYTLIHQFTASRGITPHRFALCLRVSHAERLIRAGTPLADVAAEAGFYDQAHLTRTFHKIRGITPGSLRDVVEP